MKIGLVGFPGCGKTTVFNALTGLEAATGPGARPGTNLGVVRVPDERLDALVPLYEPRKVTQAEITFADVAGGAGARALDRDVLDRMREVDALAQVLRAFDNPALVEPPDPRRELADLQAETILADLAIVERRLDRLRKENAGGQERSLLERIAAHLEEERPLRAMALSEPELRLISGYRFLSLKPLLLVLNVEEDAVAEPVPDELRAAAAEAGSGIVTLSAEVEMDIAQMPADEQPEFYQALGLREHARDRFLVAAYHLLDLITMLTVGPDECRTWPVRSGSTAPEAAGTIHSDLQRGFIRAEVIHWKDLLDLGSEARCREAGKQRSEGRDYVVQDGDVVHFRFNV